VSASQPSASAQEARRKRLTLVACILGSAVVFLDGTVVNVALPAIRTDLDAGLAAQQWVVEAYLLTLGALLLVGGSLADLFGLRRVYALGLVTFGLASLLCALAPSAGALAVLRGVQGVAGALLVPSTLAIITATFDERERGRAIGTWTAWAGAATVIGPLLGGTLIDVASWRWIFAINVVPLAVTLALLRQLGTGSERRRPGARVDVVGAVLCALGLAGPVFALIHQPAAGWSAPSVLVPLVVGGALLVAFVAWERRAPAPMLPLGLFAQRNFAVGNVATLTIYAGLGAATFFLPLFLQQVAGYDAVQAGLALMPVTVLMFVLSARAGALADRFGPRTFMGVGPLIAGAGVALLARLDAGASYMTELLPGVALFGLGLVLTVAPLTATVLGAVDERFAGVASGANNAIARVAGLLAIAVIGAIVAAQFGARLDERLAGRPLAPASRAAVAQARTRPLVVDAGAAAPRDRATVAAALEAASVSAFRLGTGVAAVLVLCGGVVSLIGIRNPRRAVAAADCPGGAILGASRDLARTPEPEPVAAQ